MKPSGVRGKYTLNSSELSKQLATGGGVELIAAIVTGGSSSAALRIIDSRAGAGEAGTGPQNWLIAANAGESTPFCPARGIIMEQGLYIELEQGGAQNGEATVFFSSTDG